MTVKIRVINWRPKYVLLFPNSLGITGVVRELKSVSLSWAPQCSCRRSRTVSEQWKRVPSDLSLSTVKSD